MRGQWHPSRASWISCCPQRPFGLNRLAAEALQQEELCPALDASQLSRPGAGVGCSWALLRLISSFLQPQVSGATQLQNVSCLHSSGCSFSLSPASVVKSSTAWSCVSRRCQACLACYSVSCPQTKTPRGPCLTRPHSGADPVAVVPSNGLWDGGSPEVRPAGWDLQGD